MDVVENLAEYKRVVAENLAGYNKGDYDYNTYLTNLLTIIENDVEDKNKYIKYMLHVLEAIKLGPADIDKDTDIKAKIELLYKFKHGLILKVADIKGDYGIGYYYDKDKSFLKLNFFFYE